MGDRQSYATSVITRLKARNIKEQRFSDLIHHSNRLLEAVDFLQKENHNRNLVIQKTEAASCADQPKAEDINMLMKCCNLQKDLAESHKKTSEYAVQIVDLKTQLEERDKLIVAQAKEIQSCKEVMQKLHEDNQSHVDRLEVLQRTLQNKIDECDTLNITYSSLENRKHDLEIENKILRNEILALKNREIAAGFGEAVPAVVPRDRVTAEKMVSKRQSQPDLAKQLQHAKYAAVKSRTQSLDCIPKIIEEANAPVSVSGAKIPSNVKFEFNAHDSDVNCVFWVPSSPQLITAGADRKVKLWDMTKTSMELKKTVRDCNSAIMSVDLDVEAGLLLCASCDFASRVWTVSDFTIRHTLTGHSGKVMSAKFLSIENQVVSGSMDQMLKLWDLRRRACIQSCSTGSYINDLVGKTGHTVISCHSNSLVNFWDIRTNTICGKIQCSAGVTSLDVSKNGSTLLTSQQDRKLALIDLRKNKEVCSLFGGDFEVACDWTRAKFSPDGKHCCCGARNGCVYVWNLQSGTVVQELWAHSAPVIACSWSSCGSYLASCSTNKKCIVWCC